MIRVEYTILNLPIWLSRPLKENQELILMQPEPISGLDDMEDGTVLRRKAKVKSSFSLDLLETAKGTVSVEDDIRPGDSYTKNTTETLHLDEINTRNIMFARGFIATMVGYKRRLIYQD